MEAIPVEQHAEELLQRRQEITTVLERLGRQSAYLTESRHFDWLDQAWDDSAARTVDRLMELYRSELSGVERALGRIQNGTFGSCLACHRPIEASRLKHLPQTEFCRECGDFREPFEAAA